MRDHLIIPDTQVKPDVCIDHLKAMGQYIVDNKPEVIIHIGDHWDMASLSSYEKPGSKYFENLSYRKDIDAGNAAMQELMKPTWAYNADRRRNKKAQYKPEMHFFMGNHEDRLRKAIHNNPTLLEGIISESDFTLGGWIRHPYQEIVNIDGVNYSHNFVNPDSLTKSIVAGTVETKMKNLGFSFTMGHSQTLQSGYRALGDGSVIQGLVAGAFYMHDEGYMGAQGNKAHWRGFAHKRNVKDGAYDLSLTSLDSLLKEYGYD